MAVTNAALLKRYDRVRMTPGNGLKAPAGMASAAGSTNVAEFGYDAPSRTLYVRFIREARLYAYPNTPPGRYRSMVNAASRGSFVWQVLRNYGRDSKPYRRLS